MGSNAIISISLLHATVLKRRGGVHAVFTPVIDFDTRLFFLGGRHKTRTVAKCIVPDWWDKVDSGI